MRILRLKTLYALDVYSRSKTYGVVFREEVNERLAIDSSSI